MREDYKVGNEQETCIVNYDLATHIYLPIGQNDKIKYNLFIELVGLIVLRKDSLSIKYV